MLEIECIFYESSYEVLNKEVHNYKVRNYKMYMYETKFIRNRNFCSGPCKRNRNVVLVRHIFSLGKPRGVGNLEWGGDGEGMGRGRSVYE